MSVTTRRAALAGLGAGSLGLVMAAHGLGRAEAQNATPPTGAGAPVDVGVTGEVLGSGQPGSAAGLVLELVRTTIAPGGMVSAHSHPGAGVVFVEAGAWGYTPLGGTTHQLTRAAVAGTPTPAEAMPIGTEVILTAGDWLYNEDPQDAIRNAGEDDVVLLIAVLAPIGEPGTTFLDAQGTPVPAP